MTAIVLTLGLFALAAIVGCGLTVAVLRRELTVVDVLLAPATGFAVIVILVVPLNRGGLPVDGFAAILAIVLACGAVVALVWHWRLVRPALGPCVPFAAVALVAFVLIAGPMLTFGLDWFSYSNDDGVNYSLSAERLRAGGLYAVPDFATVVDGRDIRAQYFFLTGTRPERCGFDELLAFVSALVRIDALRALMSVLVSLHVAGVLALAALCYRGHRPFAGALAAASLLAVSALETFGVLYQLAAQVAGVVFLTAGVARACGPVSDIARGPGRYAQWVLAAVLLAALAEDYPELTPFAAATILVYQLARKPRDLRARLGFLAGVGAMCAVVLNSYLRNVVYVLTERTSIPAHRDTLFPYYLLPSGVANFTGLLPVAAFPAEPWLSVNIALGIIVIAVAAAATIYCIRRDEPVGIVAAIFAVAVLIFFQKQGGFALYKLAMYAQPALCGVLASAFVAALGAWPASARVGAALCGVALVAVNLATQARYVASSRASIDSKVASFVEIPNVSGGRTFDVLEGLRTQLAPGDVLVSDTYNRSLGKIELFYAREFADMTFPAVDVDNMVGIHKVKGLAWDLSDWRLRAIGEAYARGWTRRFIPQEFPIDGRSAAFVRDRLDRVNRTKLWAHGSQQSPFNRLSLHLAGVASIDPRAANVLVFVGSTMGYSYVEHREPAAVYQLEHDYYSPGRSMAAIGRYLLFEVLNPTRAIRLHIAFTETLRADGQNVLPPVSVIGTGRVGFMLAGRGSASVFSGPVRPRVIHGHAYILLDMGSAPIRFVYRRHGLMRLWGRDVEIDPRALTAFLRDFSAIDAGALPTPTATISHFPEGVLRPQAQYAGLYEDGWASECVATRISVGPRGEIELRGVVPLIDDPEFSTDVRVEVDGMTALSEPLHVGDVDLRVPVSPGIHTVTWKFSRYQRLPGGDRRIVAMLVRNIGTADNANSH